MAIAIVLLDGLAVISMMAARAEVPVPIVVVVQNGRFQPPEIHAAADSPLALRVKNLDAVPIEFASSMLRLHALVSPNTSETVRIRGMRRGRYTFFDVSHPGTRGLLIVE